METPTKIAPLGSKAEAAKPPVLPALREDLVIEKGGCFQDGAPSWVLHDPIRNRFFRIGEATVQILNVWASVSVPQLISIVARTSNRVVTETDVEEVAKFLFANSLTVEAPGSDYKVYLDQENAKKKHWLNQLVHTYMFFRVPLVRPQSFLDRAWFFVAHLFTKTALWFFLFLGVVSIYLVSRQWEVFTHTFLSFLTLEGFALYALSLVIVKILHELGHAFMAKKYGVPVPIIGAAFIFLFPILYTETSAAVRLKRKKHRLLIDCGGIIVELCIAILATLLWVFLPDGPMRSIAFTTATLSWLLSLFVNLNPFMRFDGYYILSDLLGVENLQERGFNLAKWRMRELLFKPVEEPPESVNPRLARVLIAHAWGTWIYRFFLFLTIALMVYHLFFKALGIILFVVEIVWLILLPIWREVNVWWANRATYRSRRTLVSGLALGAMALIFFMPWSTRIEVPAIVKSTEEQHLFPPLSAKLVEHHFQEGKFVKKGQQLAQFISPSLDAEIRLSTLRKRLLEVRLSRAGSNIIDLAGIEVLKRELQAEAEKLSGLQRKRDKLTLVAPFDGVLANVDTSLHPNQWVDETSALGILHEPTRMELSGYVSGSGFNRLQENATGRFIPDGFFDTAIGVELVAMAPTSSSTLIEEILADTEGGQIPVMAEQNTLKPVGVWFQLDLKVSEESPPENLSNIRRGLVILEGNRESYFARVWRQVASVLIRESGF